MGFFDFLKKEKMQTGLQYAPTSSGLQPFYSSFGDNVYKSDIVVQSIRCKANEFKKLDPKHIRSDATSRHTIYDSSIARVLRNPNPLMTTADFLEKIAILLELNKNVYIYPTWYMTKGEERVYTGLYPLKPDQVTYLVDDKGRYFLKMHFSNGTEFTLKKEDVIHWRKDYGVNDYFGGGSYGSERDSEGLIRTLQEYDRLCQSIAKSIECSCSVNGIMKMNSYLSDEKMEKEREKFENALKTNTSGVMVTDMKTEYIHLPKDVKMVDKDTLEFFYQNICRANGTSLAVLNGDYTKSQKEAYYEHALEADIKALGQVLTRGLFTDRELSFGNEIILYPNDIAFMSMENKIEALKAGLPAGIFTKNEARHLLGYPPVEHGDEMPRGYNNLDHGTQGGGSSDQV